MPTRSEQLFATAQELANQANVAFDLSISPVSIGELEHNNRHWDIIRHHLLAEGSDQDNMPEFNTDYVFKMLNFYEQNLERSHQLGRHKLLVEAAGLLLGVIYKDEGLDRAAQKQHELEKANSL